MSMLKILKQLEATSSRNEKIAILTKNKNLELLKTILYVTLNPHINFYIKKIPPYSPAKKNGAPLADAVKELALLSSRKLTGNAAIEHLAKILSSLTEDDAEVIERVIERDLKCGVSDSTVNKVWKDFIPTYPCMLASAYDDKLIAKMKFPAAVQTKFDGMRFNAIVLNGTVEFRSRNGKELNLCGNLTDEFLELAAGSDTVYDGELLILNENGKIASRQEGNGILSKAQKGTLSAADAARIIAVLWDMIPYGDFVKGKSDITYLNRITGMTRRLNVLYKNSATQIKRIRYANTHTANNIEEVQELYKTALKEGEEGIILKSFDGIWEDKRAKHLIKFKAELEADLLCVDVIPGTGKYDGMLGSIVLRSADSVINVAVGTGFTDEDRSTLKKRDLIGKIVSVKYNSIIENIKGEKSLFLPVFIELRQDKTEADSIDNMVSV
jgi:ATP-dependent DNA ligase